MNVKEVLQQFVEGATDLRFNNVEVTPETIHAS